MKPSHLILICLTIALTGYCSSTSYGRNNAQKAYDGEFFQGYIGHDPIPSSKLVTDNKIYETLFYRCLRIRRKLYLAKSTENRWFKENPFKKEEWTGRLKDLGDISIELVQQLYRVNKNHVTINWKSTLITPIFLPEEASLNSINTNEDKFCFDEEGYGDTGIYRNDMKEYRSYYTVSRVAFSKDRRYALVKYSRNCAPLSGAGEFFQSFEYTNNGWKCIGHLTLWIS
jgi:hypothetical protein